MTRTLPLVKDILIVVPDSYSNDDRGKYLESLAADLLKRMMYKVIGERIRFTGMEIDLLAKHSPSNEEYYVECKFRDEKISANDIDLCIGQATRKKIKRIAFFTTSPLGKEAQGAYNDIIKDPNPNVSFSLYDPNTILNTILNANALEQIPEDHIPPNVHTASLLIHPDYDYHWLFQEVISGSPQNIIPFIPNRNSTSREISPDGLRTLLDAKKKFLGLNIRSYVDSSFMFFDSNDEQIKDKKFNTIEQVSTVAVAESLTDYRPCNPEYFVGREAIQKEAWDFFENVRKGKTENRLIAITGSSGYGKSSLIAKLAERFKNKKWKNKLFLYPVDVRSARGPLFVAESVLQALNEIHKSQFAYFSNTPTVSDADDILSSPYIEESFRILKKEGKVLILFFDQFEEALSKDELLDLFHAFRRFALDSVAFRGNLVVGFSWRTGVSLTDDNPAYRMWQDLSDHRITLKLGPLDVAESSKIVSQFERSIQSPKKNKNKMLSPLKRRLLEQGQGIPWLLKKLCIHIYNQVTTGASERSLLSSRLNVKSLFEEDLNQLSEKQSLCIKGIAKNSPADSIEIDNHFGNEITDYLLRHRLIIKSGLKYSVYWDIFRDYLNDGTVPAIPLRFIPITVVSRIIKVLEFLSKNNAQTMPSIAEHLGYAETSTENVLVDIQSLALSKKNPDASIALADDVTIDKIPSIVRAFFLEHAVYVSLLKHYPSSPGSSNAVSNAEFTELVADAYADTLVSENTKKAYVTRLIPWLEYSGLIEVEANSIAIISPQHKGKRFGVIDAKKESRRHGDHVIFLPTSSPSFAYSLFEGIAQGNITDYNMTYKQRKASPDLVSLGLMSDTKGNGISVAAKSDPYGEFVRAVFATTTIKFVDDLLKNNPALLNDEVGRQLAIHLGKKWKDGTMRRYTTAICSYRKYVLRPRNI